jgi:hypothetical protein
MAAHDQTGQGRGCLSGGAGLRATSAVLLEASEML